MSSTNNPPSQPPPLSKALLSRIQKESKQLILHPPTGIAFWNSTDDQSSLTQWNASIVGPNDSPYHHGTFNLHVTLPDRYPFIPPIVRFITPIYHPNIDESGRICLDLLNMPPKGSWNPGVNLLGILTSLQSLLQNPNPDDPLLQHIAQQYKTNQQLFMKQAREWTEKYAMQGGKSGSSSNTDKQQTKDEKLDHANTMPAVEAATIIPSTAAAAQSSEVGSKPFDQLTDKTNLPSSALQSTTATTKRKREDAVPTESASIKR